VRLSALQAGDIHTIRDGNIRDQDVKLVKEDKNLTYAQQAGYALGTFSFNLSVPPFNNKALRQAVAYALDRPEIIRAIYEGNRDVGYSFSPTPIRWARDESYKPYEFSLQKAKEKLAEGGAPKGFEFTYWTAAGSSIGQQLAELMQAQLATVGIKMKI